MNTVVNLSIEELHKKQEKKYKDIFDKFEIGQRIELSSSSYEPDIPLGATGKILDKKYSKNGCDLRVDFEGYETWIDGEDVF
ncbi:hypothetical protein CUC43_31875 (plasmid) [Bacillus thuringiensis LM1212]|uniref:Uncharacterized protein n=1 Tax=Bacillus paranthracis TaxID=2026186 RepID=A0AAJ1KH64_9BACI|nr:MULTISPECIES: hypothetical protein [Bacillus cereus group]QDF27154.1 hypothetical protein FJR70_30490 [Bacillus tropicus]HDW3055455.1 hypothetical protein [Bacillus cereus]AXY11249.1 hypothetical protein CUC43_31875 [Bacillus thuringiensis LM1212]MDG0950881.1 hypothetical protein [Bacillus paranthracis]MDG0956545.1 hypothetical protein [Bacillus paranthracis]